MTPAEIAALRKVWDDAQEGIEDDDLNAILAGFPSLLDEVERLRGALRGMLTRHGEPGPTSPFRCVCFDCETARRVLGEAGKEER